MSKMSNTIVEILEFQENDCSTEEIAAFLNLPIEIVETALTYEENYDDER